MGADEVGAVRRRFEMCGICHSHGSSCGEIGRGIGGGHFGFQRGDGFAFGQMKAEKWQFDVPVAVDDFAILGNSAADSFDAYENGIAFAQGR